MITPPLLDDLEPSAAGNLVLNDLASTDPNRATQASEALSSGKYNVAPDVQAVAGVAPADLQAQLLFFESKHQANESACCLQLPQLRRVRDAENGATVQLLTAGQVLNLQLTSSIDGYLTLLNLGTSGRLRLLCPGVMARVFESQVTSGKKYSLPHDLEHNQMSASIYEGGPIGWERFIAVITPQPIIEAMVELDHGKRVTDLDGRCSFPDIRPAVMNALIEKLKALPPKQWAVACLKFEVVN